jgi:hypothetical protein
MTNPGEHRTLGPKSSGKSPCDAEPLVQGLVTVPARRGESISQAERGAELTVQAEGAKGQKGRRSRKRQANLEVVKTL